MRPPRTLMALQGLTNNQWNHPNPKPFIIYLGQVSSSFLLLTKSSRHWASSKFKVYTLVPTLRVNTRYHHIYVYPLGIYVIIMEFQVSRVFRKIIEVHFIHGGGITLYGVEAHQNGWINRTYFKLCSSLPIETSPPTNNLCRPFETRAAR